MCSSTVVHMCYWSSCSMVLISLSFNFLNCKIRIAAVTDFIRWLWGLNELIKWISSRVHYYLQLFHYSIQFRDDTLYGENSKSLSSVLSLKLRIIHPTASSEAPFRHAIKYLKLNIFKLNSWSSSEQTSSTCSCAFHSWRQFPSTSSSDQNPQSHSWLALYMRCIRRFYQLCFFSVYPESSLFSSFPLIQATIWQVLLQQSPASTLASDP